MRKQKGVSESEVKIVDALRKEESYTINDIYALPDGERAELIDGKIYYITDAGCNGAPEWVIEVVSPGSRSMDYFTKLFKYRTAGVKEYWIVDYAKNLIMVYRFEKDTLEQYDFGEDVSVGIFDGFSVKVE